jgi:hypothetical protein
MPGGYLNHPTFGDVMLKLEALRDNDGTVSLETSTGVRPWKELSLHGNEGAYFILFNDNIDGKKQLEPRLIVQ